MYPNKVELFTLLLEALSETEVHSYCLDNEEERSFTALKLAEYPTGIK